MKNYIFQNNEGRYPFAIIVFPVGNIYENKENFQKTHIVEHLLMINFLKHNISLELDKNNISIDGYTRHYFTELLVTTNNSEVIIKNFLEKILLILDNFEFSEEDLIAAKNTVIEEFTDEIDDIKFLIDYELSKLVFNDRDIYRIGFTEQIGVENIISLIKRYKKKEITNWYKKFFYKNYLIYHFDKEKFENFEIRDITIKPPRINNIKNPNYKKIKNYFNGWNVMGKILMLKPNFNFEEIWMLAIIRRMLKGLNKSLFAQYLFKKGLMYLGNSGVVVENYNGLSLLKFFVLFQNKNKIEEIRDFLNNIINFLKNKELFELVYESLYRDVLSTAHTPQFSELVLEILFTFGERTKENDYKKTMLEAIIKKDISYKKFLNFLDKFKKDNIYSLEIT